MGESAPTGASGSKGASSSKGKGKGKGKGADARGQARPRNPLRSRKHFGASTRSSLETLYDKCLRSLRPQVSKDTELYVSREELLSENPENPAVASGAEVEFLVTAGARARSC